MPHTLRAGSLRLLIKAALLSLAVIVAGCGATRPNGPSPSSKNIISGTRVAFKDKCVRAENYTITTAEGSEGKESGFLLQLTTALVPSVLNKLVDFAGAYAEKVGKEYAATSTAATSATLADDKIRGCIIYVVGTFGNEEATADGGWSAVQLNVFGLARRPDVYAEFVLHSVDGDGKYAAITPVFLDFSAAHAKRTSNDGIKDLAFVIELGVPSNTIAATAGATFGPAPPAAVPAGGAPVVPLRLQPKPVMKLSARIALTSRIRWHSTQFRSARFQSGRR
ncbi:hypothetical protein [Thauera sp. SDU_THAU2]|uniref:hypothetical protein n=1 Tax=Thauera sp. SDU_THAU2 TaxID=3136633 RepID=UPI00311FD895